MKYQNITLLGTSHIAKQSLKEVEETIQTEKPEIIALELDEKRLHALLSKKKRKTTLKDIKRIGFKGYLFSIIGAWVEKKLGEKVGVSPGSEMLKAFKIAREKQLKIALIDQDIEITLKKFSKSLGWKEKWNLLTDIIKGVLFKSERIEFDLTKVPEEKLIKKMIEQVKKRYPKIYQVLVEERNIIMARRLAKISKDNPESKILAVIGAGHQEEMINLLKRYLNSRTDII